MSVPPRARATPAQRLQEATAQDDVERAVRKWRCVRAIMDHVIDGTSMLSTVAPTKDPLGMVYCLPLETIPGMPAMAGTELKDWVHEWELDDDYEELCSKIFAITGLNVAIRERGNTVTLALYKHDARADAPLVCRARNPVILPAGRPMLSMPSMPPPIGSMPSMGRPVMGSMGMSMSMGMGPMGLQMGPPASTATVQATPAPVQPTPTRANVAVAIPLARAAPAAAQLQTNVAQPQNSAAEHHAAAKNVHLLTLMNFRQKRMAAQAVYERELAAANAAQVHTKAGLEQKRVAALAASHAAGQIALEATKSIIELQNAGCGQPFAAATPEQEHARTVLEEARATALAASHAAGRMASFATQCINAQHAAAEASAARTEAASPDWTEVPSSSPETAAPSEPTA